MEVYGQMLILVGKRTLSTLTSQHKNGSDSVGTLYRVVSVGMEIFVYSNKGQNDTCILPYQNFSLVSLGVILSHCHITLTYHLPSLSNSSML